MTCAPEPWQDVAARLRPFIARRVPGSEVDDVLQDVWVRMQRGLPGLRDEQRFSPWLYQLARNAVTDHLRTRARHPLPVADAAAAVDTPDVESEDDRAVSRSLATCVSGFVGLLPSPYREAVTLVELENLTAREAAAMTGVSLTAMKSRVERGRAQLRRLFETCCEIALDARGKVTDYVPRPQPTRCPAR